MAAPKPTASSPQGAALLADPRAHLAAFAAPDTAALMKSADLCGACHTEIYDLSMSKAEVPQAVQSTFTEWRDSWYGKNGVTCQDCHMAADPAAQIEALRAGKPVKPERISHRFIGTNHLMADPGLGDTRSLLRGGLLPGMDSAGDAATLAEQSRQTEAFLRAAAGLDLRAQRLAGDRLSLDLAVQNLGAGHNLPTGVNDQKHMWLEITLTDAQGRVVYQSGQDGAETPGTVAWLEHFRDAKGERITNHLTFATAEVVWIRKPIAAKSEEIVSYDIALPADAAFPLHLSARLMYRIALPDLLFKNLGHRALDVPAFAMAELGGQPAWKPPPCRNLLPFAPSGPSAGSSRWPCRPWPMAPPSPRSTPCAARPAGSSGCCTVPRRRNARPRLTRIWLAAAAAWAAAGLADADLAGKVQHWQAAAETGDAAATARARQVMWAALTVTARDAALAAIDAGDAVTAGTWLTLRDYARASGDTTASAALQALAAGEMTPDAARAAVEAELLTVAASELRLAIEPAQDDAAAGHAIAICRRSWAGSRG